MFTQQELKQNKHLIALEKKRQEAFKDLIKKRLYEGYFEKLFKAEIEKSGYTKKFGFSRNKFMKNGKIYSGKIAYKKNKYVLVNENNEYIDGFAFEPV